MRFNQVGDQRAERVVVTELDFVRDYRVILVDDRYDAVAEQRMQRVAGIEVAFAVGEVLVRQQDLRRFQPMFSEGGFIGLGEPHLAHGGGGLQVVHGLRAGFPAEALHAGRDGARGDEQNLAPLFVQRGDLACTIGDELVGQPFAVVGDERAADFDDEPLTLGYPGSHRA